MNQRISQKIPYRRIQIICTVLTYSNELCDTNLSSDFFLPNFLLNIVLHTQFNFFIHWYITASQLASKN